MGLLTLGKDSRRDNERGCPRGKTGRSHHQKFVSLVELSAAAQRGGLVSEG